jgi:hypothetical protein
MTNYSYDFPEVPDGYSFGSVVKGMAMLANKIECGVCHRPVSSVTVLEKIDGDGPHLYVCILCLSDWLEKQDLA